MGTIEDTRPKNRRQSQRRRTRTSVRIQCRKGSHGLGTNVASAVLDTSESGIRLIVAQPLEPMSEVEIIFDSHGMSASIKRLGKVCWQVKLENGQFCIGVQFQKKLVYCEWQNLVAPN
jgi:hypothetical protein